MSSLSGPFRAFSPKRTKSVTARSIDYGKIVPTAPALVNHARHHSTLARASKSPLMFHPDPRLDRTPRPTPGLQRPAPGSPVARYRKNLPGLLSGRERPAAGAGGFCRRIRNKSEQKSQQRSQRKRGSNVGIGKSLQLLNYIKSEFRGGMGPFRPGSPRPGAPPGPILRPWASLQSTRQGRVPECRRQTDFAVLVGFAPVRVPNPARFDSHFCQIWPNHRHGCAAIFFASRIAQAEKQMLW